VEVIGVDNLERECREALSCVDPERSLPNATDLCFLARRGLLAMKTRFLQKGGTVVLENMRSFASPVICVRGGRSAEPPLDTGTYFTEEQVRHGYCGILYNAEKLRYAGGRLNSPERYRRELFVTSVHEVVHWYFLIRYGHAYRFEIQDSEHVLHERRIEALSQLFVREYPEEEATFLKPLDRVRRSDQEVFSIGRLRAHYALFPMGWLSLDARLDALRWQNRNLKGI
jgi:hypothetical protein